MNKLIVILGPTASGKTGLAIKLAKFFSGEIVSADSRQIYRGMDIGTAKPFRNQKSKIKNQNDKSKLKNKKNEKPIFHKNIAHYLINIINPTQEFTVAEFKKRAIKIIKDIQRRGKIPFLVGGTGLYLQAVIDNLEIPEVKPDKKLREKLEKKSHQALFQQLKKLDSSAAKDIDPNNKRRLIRALEVCLKTKKRFSQLKRKGKSLFDVLQIGIKISRSSLYKKINQRVEQIIKNGLVNEVKKLCQKYSPLLPAMSGISYQEIISYLQKKMSLKEAIEEIKKNTRHFAKRQMTWFSAHGGSASGGKRDKRIHWLKNYQEIKKRINRFLK